MCHVAQAPLLEHILVFQCFYTRAMSWRKLHLSLAECGARRWKRKSVEVSGLSQLPLPAGGGSASATIRKSGCIAWHTTSSSLLTALVVAVPPLSVTTRPSRTLQTLRRVFVFSSSNGGWDGRVAVQSSSPPILKQFLCF